jgi:hypothetical protein
MINAQGIAKDMEEGGSAVTRLHHSCERSTEATQLSVTAADLKAEI